ncbi:uncharacterized protein [Nicotiana tomentosiformis]|uniref:uncharacterized protein n=1 Tax=Nicotiana tomentosiformis TaxID=4098 RepID=UPI00388CA6F1
MVRTRALVTDDDAPGAGVARGRDKGRGRGGAPAAARGHSRVATEESTVALMVRTRALVTDDDAPGAGVARGRDKGRGRGGAPAAARGHSRVATEESTVALQARGRGYAGRELPRGEGHARCYAFRGRSEDFSSDVVIINICLRGSLGHDPSRVVSFLKAQQMVEKGCLAYLTFLRDLSADTHTVESVLIVIEFQDMFLVDLPVEFLGHVVSSDGIKIDLEGFSIQLSDECEESFQKLKTALTITPILPLPSVYCDASRIGIGVRQYDDPHLLVLKVTVPYDDSKEVNMGYDGVLMF